MNLRAAIGNGNLGRVNVYASGFQSVPHRESLINRPDNIQVHMLIQPAVIGIKIVRVPLEPRAGSALGVVGAIIEMHGQAVFFAAEQHVIGDVDAV